MVRTLAAARKARLMTYEETRIYAGMDPTVPEPDATESAPELTVPTDPETPDNGGVTP